MTGEKTGPRARSTLFVFIKRRILVKLIFHWQFEQQSIRILSESKGKKTWNSLERRNIARNNVKNPKWPGGSLRKNWQAMAIVFAINRE